MVDKINILPEDNILIIAPHPDDESIGCGGLMILYPNQCDVLLITDGRHGHTGEYLGKEDELVSIRKKEILKALTHVKINTFYVLDLPDGKTIENEDIVKNFNYNPYDYVFIPNRFDGNRDHAALFEILSKYKKNSANFKLVEYEVGTLLEFPVWTLDISNVMNEKLSMISEHTSQLHDINYIKTVEALNSYRGGYNGVQYAEAYCPSDYITVGRIIFWHLPFSLRNMIYKVRDKIKRKNINEK